MASTSNNTVKGSKDNGSKTAATAKTEAPKATASGATSEPKLERASERHTGSAVNSKVEGARVRTGASGQTKAYLPPIATRKKMLQFASTLATKTSKRLKKWTSENVAFGEIAKQIDAAIVSMQGAMMDLDKLPQSWEPTRTVNAVNIGGFAVGDSVRIREKRHGQYSDVMGDAVKQNVTVTKVGKSKIVIKMSDGNSTVIAKSHLVDAKMSIEEERATQTKVDEARKAKKDAAATPAA